MWFAFKLSHFTVFTRCHKKSLLVISFEVSFSLCVFLFFSCFVCFNIKFLATFRNLSVLLWFCLFCYRFRIIVIYYSFFTIELSEVLCCLHVAYLLFSFLLSIWMLCLIDGDGQRLPSAERLQIHTLANDWINQLTNRPTESNEHFSTFLFAPI